jgi:hypothetical protein
MNWRKLMITKQKIKKGKYNILFDGEIVGQVAEQYVGRNGYARMRWIGEYKDRFIHGETMKDAIDMGVSLKGDYKKKGV